ncbi:MAG: DUF1223 domain-containing protein [Bdellovibrionales bacterium]
MIKPILFAGLLIAALVLWNQKLQAYFGDMKIPQTDHPVVVELFTSQSCSSCPPADQNLAALADTQNIIALGFHVTYWDHLNWKDTLSRDFATDRQRRYAAENRSGRVYTPQIIVNGDEGFVGSNRAKITATLKNANDITPIILSETSSALQISIPDFPKQTSKSVTFWLFGVKKEYTQSIPSGENRGKTVTYRNAVLEQQQITRTGQIQNFEIEKPHWPDIDRYVLITQDNAYGKITAAGQIDF